MLKELQHYARIYLVMQKKYIQSRLEYRADFFISTIGLLMMNGVGLVSLWLLFQSTSTIAGWTLDEIIFLYGFFLFASTPAQIIFDHVWNLRDYILEGTFIKYYFRPVNMLFYFIAERFDVKGFGQLLVAIIALVYGSIQVDIEWTLGKIGMFLMLWFGAALINIGLLVGSACSAFWMVWSFPVMNFIFRAKDFGRYPITIFTGAFRTIFTWILPIGFVAYYPSLYFLDKGDIPRLTYFTPVMGVIVFGLSCILWSRGVQRYNGTGS